MFVFKTCMQKYIGKNSTLSDQNVWNKNNTVEDFIISHYSFLPHVPWLNKDTSKGFCPCPCTGTNTTEQECNLSNLKVLDMPFPDMFSSDTNIVKGSLKSCGQMLKNVGRKLSNWCIITEHCSRIWDTVLFKHLLSQEHVFNYWTHKYFSNKLICESLISPDLRSDLWSECLDSHPFFTSFSYRSSLSFLSVKTERTKLLGHTSQAFAMCCS